jgi:hypothetical protein
MMSNHSYLCSLLCESTTSLSAFAVYKLDIILEVMYTIETTPLLDK